MTTNNFRTIALTLRGYVEDTYNLLAATDAVEAILPNLDMTVQVTEMTPDRLDAIGFASVKVMRPIFEGKGINAIKEHRTLTDASLREAKDSYERLRALPVVQEALAVIAERNTEVTRLKEELRQARESLLSWQDHQDRDEPPF